MSESTFPFDAGQQPLAVDEAPASNRNVLIAGGLAAALLLGAAGYFLLGIGGGSHDTALGVTPVLPRHAVTKTVAVRPAVAKPVVKVPLASTEHLGRNPFKALYVQPVAAVAPASTGTSGTTTGSNGSTGTTGTTTGSTGTTGTSGTTGTPGTTTSATAPYALSLTTISKPSPETRFFTFNVAGKSVTVIPAQRFGTYGELIVLAYTKNAAGTATGAIIQVGDDNPIDVKIGEKVRVL